MGNDSEIKGLFQAVAGLASVLVTCGITPLVREGPAPPGDGRPPWPEVAWLSPQLGRSAGPPLLQLLLDLLRRLVLHCAQLDAQNQEKCEAALAEADLFLDAESVASLELAGDKVLWLRTAVLTE